MASIGTLAAGLGHDMHNMLLPARAHLNAARAMRLPRRARERLDAVQKCVSYLQQLADGLHYLVMDPDTPGDHRTHMAKWWSQTGPLLSKSVPKHVRLVSSVPARLPWIAVAPHRLTQAVLNLIVNAGAAIPKGREQRPGLVRVWADADRASGVVRIGVTDNGVGMRDEVKRRAFEMFFTTKPRGMGTGLGLPLVHSVASGAGGTVRIDSAVGEGTTVVMEFPAAPEPHGTSRASAVVTIGDGRSRSLVRQILESGNARVRVGPTPGRADIWVVAPAEASMSAARAWLKAKPAGRLVLFGEPPLGVRGGDDWHGLRPLVIGNTKDLRAIVSALNLALTEEGRVDHEPGGAHENESAERASPPPRGRVDPRPLRGRPRGARGGTSGAVRD